MSVALTQLLDPQLGSLSEQLAARIRQAIGNGELRPGDRLPPSRNLASELGIARGTVTVALEILVAEGLLHSVTGSGTFVSTEANLSPALTTTANGGLADHVVRMPKILPVPDIDEDLPTGFAQAIDFRPCGPSLENFPLAQWRRSLAAASTRPPTADYGDPRGLIDLRIEIAAYLRRARGLQVVPEQIMLTNGAVHGMHLLASLYLNPETSFVFEDPGYPLVRQTLQLSGAKILPCEVDEDGLNVAALPNNPSNVRLVYVTPSHQFPTGGHLSLGRRQALIAWAEKHGALIIEDDYDGEFRYDVPPLAPLAAMANHCVVYCGTFSKTLFPGLRLGYVVAPQPLIDALANYRAITEQGSNVVLPLAVARFINDGHFERHVHRMRRVYARKRAVLAQVLNTSGNLGELWGLQSGLNALLQLAPGLNAQALADTAAQQGILVSPLQRYRLDRTVQDADAIQALVIGYAEAAERDIRLGIAALASMC